MVQVCPISFEQINERVAQTNAAFVVLSMAIFLFTSFKWIIFLLILDFFTRGFWNPSYSLFSACSRTILRLLHVQPNMVNAGPKIFAAKVGFFFCLIVCICYLSGFQMAAYVTGGILMFFAGLEACFRFCLACRMYPYVCKITGSLD